MEGASEALETGDCSRGGPRADHQEEECYQQNMISPARPPHCSSSVSLTTVKEGKLGASVVVVVRLINNILFIMSPLHSTQDEAKGQALVFSV